MLNSAWPSNMWHLFDYYYQVGGSGFGAKKACSSAVHLLYSYPSQADNDHETSNGYVWAVNSRYTPSDAGLVAEATQFELDGTVVKKLQTPITEPLESDGVRRLMPLDLYPKPDDNNADGNASVAAAAARTETILVRLRLTSGGDSETAAVIEDNWYWLPPKLDKFEMGGCFTGCDIDRFANMRDIVDMPSAPALVVTVGDPTPAQDGLVSHTVKLKAADADERGAWLAFFVRLRALDADGKDVLPATWSDNFVSLQAGESVELTLEHEADAVVDKVVAKAFNAPSPDETSGGHTVEKQDTV